MKKIEQNLEQLADCFVDVHEEVKAQAENLTVVENNTSNAKAETSHGVQELTEVILTFDQNLIFSGE
jgi:t-SNARE complex subunit (syntaxin)